jgi:hypothetical protein
MVALMCCTLGTLSCNIQDSIGTLVYAILDLQMKIFDVHEVLEGSFVLTKPSSLGQKTPTLVDTGMLLEI